MHRNFGSLVFMFLFLSSGCSPLTMSDKDANNLARMVGATNVPSHSLNHEQQVEEIRQELLGLSQKEVLDKLGRPSWTLQLGDNYQAPAKFRENQNVFDGVKKCRMSECGPIFEDEKWAYNCEKRRVDYCGFGVFLKNGIVVAVE